MPLELPDALDKKSTLRVRVHLNLNHPELAENAVRIQSRSGAWITVAYATELALENCVPVVDAAAQERVRTGASKKTPHAFIEGNLVHFKGRERPAAPPLLAQKARRFLISNPVAAPKDAAASAINYNPRFAACFYEDKPEKAGIDQKLESATKITAVGWNFRAEGAVFSPLLPGHRCNASTTKKPSFFELAAIRKGLKATSELSAQPAPRQVRPRR